MAHPALTAIERGSCGVKDIARAAALESADRGQEAQEAAEIAPDLEGGAMADPC